MCCCGKPTINGEMGYRWQPNDEPGIRPVNPPDMQEGDSLICDEPGRCGGLDSHCHHYRVVMRHGSPRLLVRHGGGDEVIDLFKTVLQPLAALDSNGRYWLLQAIQHAHSKGATDGRFREQERWKRAAIDKRIKVRKERGSVRVEITPEVLPEPFSKELIKTEV
jgi:hypothetical protein